MDRGAWRATVDVVARSGTHLPLTAKLPEKATAAHSSTLAWKIPWMEEAGGLPSMVSPRVGHD